MDLVELMLEHAPSLVSRLLRPFWKVVRVVGSLFLGLYEFSGIT